MDKDNESVQPIIFPRIGLSRIWDWIEGFLSRVFIGGGDNPGKEEVPLWPRETRTSPALPDSRMHKTSG